MSDDIDTYAGFRAALPEQIEGMGSEGAGELSVSDLTALDWEGTGSLYGNFDSAEDARHDNTLRAGWALAAVEAFADRVGGISSEPVEQQIADMLGDLMHLCDALGLDFDHLTSRGALHYDAESRGTF